MLADILLLLWEVGIRMQVGGTGWGQGEGRMEEWGEVI